VVKTKKEVIEERNISSDELVQLVVHGMQEKKAENIAIINLKHIRGAVCDYFVIASGNSPAQIDAITDSIEEEVVKKTEQHPWHREGKEHKEWILLDYVDVVAHVFKKDRRAFYGLEELWGDAEITYVPES
jgi:ribosome-associated protein